MTAQILAPVSVGPSGAQYAGIVLFFATIGFLGWLAGKPRK